MIARNVLAHIDNINNFFEAISLITKSKSIIFIEFHSLSEIVKYNQYDSVYHEHNFYLTLSFIEIIKKIWALSIRCLTWSYRSRFFINSTHKDKKHSMKSLDYQKQIRIEKKLNLNKRITYQKFADIVTKHN